MAQEKRYAPISSTRSWQSPLGIEISIFFICTECRVYTEYGVRCIRLT
jgi:hypothetical protein